MWSDYVITITGESSSKAACEIYEAFQGGGNGTFKSVVKKAGCTVLHINSNRRDTNRVFSAVSQKCNVRILALNSIEYTDIDNDGEVYPCYAVGAIIADKGTVNASWKNVTAEEYENVNCDGIRPCDIDVLQKLTGCAVIFNEENPYEPMFNQNGDLVGLSSLKLAS